jgi:hypothetical protein
MLWELSVQRKPAAVDMFKSAVVPVRTDQFERQFHLIIYYLHSQPDFFPYE